MRLSYRRLVYKRSQKQAYLWKAYSIITGLDDLPEEERYEAIKQSLMTRKGKSIARELGLLPRPRLVVMVRPYRRAKITGNRHLDISPHLKDGRYLRLRINLTESLTMTQAQLRFTLSRYLSHVKNRPQRVRRSKKRGIVQLRQQGDQVYAILDLFQPIDAIVSSITSYIRPLLPKKGRSISLNDTHLKLLAEYFHGKSQYRIAKELTHQQTSKSFDPHSVMRTKIRRILHKFSK